MGERIYTVKGIPDELTSAFEELAYDVTSVNGQKDAVVSRRGEEGTRLYEFSGIEEVIPYPSSDHELSIAEGRQSMIFVDSQQVFSSQDSTTYVGNINIARRSIWTAQQQDHRLAPQIILDTIAAAARGEEMPQIPVVGK